MKQYDVLSPDGISINPFDFYPDRDSAKYGLMLWIEHYRKQGYYSTIIGGDRVRIPVDQIPDYCKIIEVNP